MSRKRKTSNILSYLIIFILIVGSYLLLDGLNNQSNELPINQNQENTGNQQTTVLSNLIVEFIDVGQADSILILTPNEKTILIDAGEPGDYNKIKDTIDKFRISKLDIVIATHPHSDHIGSMQKIIENYEIGKVYMPDKIHTSKTFENLLLAMEKKGLKIDIAEAGIKIDLDEALDLSFVSPNDDFQDLNNVSAVLKLVYKENSFLFTGDMETKTEELIIDNIDVDVLKVGHHGSDTSSSIKFLDRVTPKIAVISVGKDNKYNHPSQEILDRLNNVGAQVYRTDEKGNITITSNGINMEIDTER